MSSTSSVLRDALGDRLEVYRDRASWLERRRIDYSIGGSDVSAILGVSPWASPWDIYLAKREGIYPERSPEDQAILDRGTRFEPVVLAEYAHATGRELVSAGDGVAIVRHPEHPWAIGSCDAFAVDDGVLGVVEAKTATRADGWGPETEILEWADGSEAAVRPVYALQVYWYLEATGLPWCDLAVLLPRLETRVFRIHRDAALQAEILDRVAAWRRRHLVEGEPPDVDGSEAARAYLTQRFPGDSAKQSRPATGEQAEIIAALCRVKAELKRLEEREMLLKGQLMAAMGDTYKVTSPAGAAVYTLPSARRSIDAKKLEAEYPKVAAACARVTEIPRSIRVTAAKEGR